MRREARWLVLLLALGGVLAACDQGNVFDLSVGDCFDQAEDFDGGEISEVPIVDCDEPHDFEIYAIDEWADGDDHPGESALLEWAEQTCYDAFEGYVGTSFERSALSYNYFTPSSGSWASGDREVACMLLEVDSNGQLVQLEGSMRGSGR